MYLLVEICWSGESAGAVTDAGLTAADWDTVVLGLFKPACVSPVRVVVDATAVKLKGEQSGTENSLVSGAQIQYVSGMIRT